MEADMDGSVTRCLEASSAFTTIGKIAASANGPPHFPSSAAGANALSEEKAPAGGVVTMHGHHEQEGEQEAAVARPNNEQRQQSEGPKECESAGNVMPNYAAADGATISNSVAADRPEEQLDKRELASEANAAEQDGSCSLSFLNFLQELESEGVCDLMHDEVPERLRGVSGWSVHEEKMEDWRRRRQTWFMKVSKCSHTCISLALTPTLSASCSLCLSLRVRVYACIQTSVCLSV